MESLLISTFNNDKYIVVNDCNKNLVSYLKLHDIENIILLLKKLLILDFTQEVLHHICKFYHKINSPKFLEYYNIFNKKYGMTQEMIWNLIDYYKENKNNETNENKNKNLIKYYLMGIEKNDSKCMHDLGTCCKNVGDTENMLKYYQMAYENKHTDSAYELASYYKNTHDNDNYIKFLTTAIEYDNDNYTACYDLATHYQNINDIEPAIKYYDLLFKKYTFNQPYKQDCLRALHYVYDYYHNLANNDQMVSYAQKINLFNDITLKEVDTLIKYRHVRI